MNKAILIGRLTADPELQTIGNGADVCRFTLAINRPYKNQAGETQADFLNIVVWRNAAQNCARYLRKGSQCAVTGSIQTRSYDDKDGNRRYVTEIVADNVEFLGGKATSDFDDGYESFKPAKAEPKKPKIETLEPVEDEDLPF